VGFAAALRCIAMAMMVGDELKALLDAKLQPVLTDPSHFSDLTLVRTTITVIVSPQACSLSTCLCSPLVSVLANYDAMVMACASSLLLAMLLGCGVTLSNSALSRFSFWGVIGELGVFGLYSWR
jgi:hypothetical protein